eukprot:m.213282 g.213282  ORF g.213282 m.213282 type:complete len:939 (-) comp18603_c2_seq1:36-2852(-)
MAAVPLAVSNTNRLPGAVGLAVLFGSTLVAWLSLSLLRLRQAQLFQDPHDSGDPGDGASKKPKKQLSRPLDVTSLLSCWRLGSEVVRFAAILLLAYCAEYHPFYPHGHKDHDMDMFWFLVLLLLLASLLDIRKTSTTDLVNREQTEEWKGWMQFMFLLYHYYSAHEVYNGIRVMITCYVWMTGFGNFSFFYIKRDFGIVRVLQMMWRLNFLVVFLCLTMGNTYILYYICPLHTFFFLMVYCIMYVGHAQGVNHGKWGVRIKLFVAALLIFLVWDSGLGIFNLLFGAVLPTSPQIGATSGVLWEWYFRSSLDHWSTLLGMVFALNFPIMTAWFLNTEARSTSAQFLIKGAVAVVLGLVLYFWAAHVFPLPKLEYNSLNAYTGIMPVLAYLFFRNCSVTLRSYYLHPLHSIGKITLETYLMQHHLWLTSNAKTLLVLVPGYPRVNLLVVMVIYVLASKELYRLTMSLRGMLLPDDKVQCVRNFVVVLCTVCASYVTGLVAVKLFASSLVVAVVSLSATFGLAVTIALVWRHGLTTRDLVVPVASATFALACAAAIFGFVIAPTSVALKTSTSSFSGSQDCIPLANQGRWSNMDSHCDAAGKAVCNAKVFRWVNTPDNCHFHVVTKPEVEKMLNGQPILFAGDSVARFIYHSTRHILGADDNLARDPSQPGHQDASWVSDSGVAVDFLWAPTAKELTAKLARQFDKRPAALVTHIGLWDALHGRDLNAFKNSLKELQERWQERNNGKADPAIPVFWVLPTTVVDQRLMTPEKREFMTEEIVQGYREAVRSQMAPWTTGVVEGGLLTQDRQVESYDGVHFLDTTYDVLAQVVFNQLQEISPANTGLTLPSKATTKGKREAVGMSNSGLGVAMLFFIAVMLLLLDNFGGVTWLALAAADSTLVPLSWDAAYSPLLKKLAIGTKPSPIVAPPPEPANPVRPDIP